MHGLNLLDQVIWMNSTNPTSPDTALSYDANGNMTAAAVTYPGIGTLNVGYEWDIKNQLTAVNIPGVQRSEFSYDGLGRRIRIVEKNGSNVITSDRYFVWQGMRIAEERAAGVSAPTKIFTSFGEIRTGGVKYYYTRDHLGSVREVLDGNGNIVARYDYDPFGVPTQTLGTLHFDMLYTGHFYHWASGLYLAPYRAYNPGMGRWISRDPIGMAGGMNLYGYVGNNPLKSSDPTGLSAETNGRFLLDWALGTENHNRIYADGSTEVSEMKRSAGVNRLREAFYATGFPAKRTGDYGTFEGYIHDYLNPLTRNPTSTSAQVGGWANGTAINNGNGTVTFTIKNTAGTHSFWLHLVPNRECPSGPMANIYQTFTWTEPIPLPFQPYQGNATAPDGTTNGSLTW